MRLWLRAVRQTRCGRCGETIRGPKPDRPADVMLEVRQAGNRFSRCVPCAINLFGERPPDSVTTLGPGTLPFPEGA